MAISSHLSALRRKIGHDLLQIPSVAGIIRNNKGHILLQRQAEDGHWTLPAGAIDPGEQPAQALVREVWEETGLRVRPTQLLGVFSGAPDFRHTYPNGDQVEYMVAVFACTALGGVLEGQDDETAELRYFAPDRVPALQVAYPRHLFDTKTGPAFVWDEAWLE